ncbi:carboxypeptidase-like regulatory domain-containing protein [Pedobacter sandarakinus]|uniref:carboxypeptidase-like regulatory domain-containing protein n=1 Tax=Pedobacter sandarakinus TaxID=353156 RepID=UPI002247F21C|nr:carboxypeptidase-like regulatory domain-containing protein [Pedobacter sandarakinus]MCX2573594.1 carboxypeptidase-like regulatory domain-containing protein [Pedobacter sandarakinus]
MKKFNAIFLTFLCALLALVPAISCAQKMVQGKVLNADTKKPVDNANIYFDNTQIKSKTTQQGLFKLYADKIYQKLIVSAIGYEKATVDIKDESANYYTILLSEKVIELQDVNIRSGVNDWQRWGDLFARLLLGNDRHISSRCEFLNKKDILFYFDEDNMELRVSSKKPILISNMFLGYYQTLDLETFTYNFITDEVRWDASIYYTPLPQKDNHHESTLKYSYLGSKMHFYRSLFGNNLLEEGFKCYKYTAVKNLNKARVFAQVQKYRAKRLSYKKKVSEFVLDDNRDSSKYYAKVLREEDFIRWDTTRIDAQKYIYIDTLTKQTIFFPKDSIMVLYTPFGGSKVQPDFEGISTFMSTKKTIMFLTEDNPLILHPAGFVSTNALMMVGYMGEKRLAQLLPFDFIYSH